VQVAYVSDSQLFRAIKPLRPNIVANQSDLETFPNPVTDQPCCRQKEKERLPVHKSITLLSSRFVRSLNCVATCNCLARNFAIPQPIFRTLKALYFMAAGIPPEEGVTKDE
jgi:hypothetical protein